VCTHPTHLVCLRHWLVYGLRINSTKQQTSSPLVPTGNVKCCKVIVLGSRRRRLLGQNAHLLEVTVLLNLLPLQSLLLVRQNVFLPHSDLEAFLESTSLAEPTVGQIHLTLLIVRTLEVTLQRVHRTA